MGWHGVAWLIMGPQPWGGTEECKFLQAQGRMREEDTGCPQGVQLTPDTPFPLAALGFQQG